MSDGRRNYQADKEKLRMAKNLIKSHNKKIKKALEVIDGLLESPDTFVFRSVMVTPEVSLLDILEKLKKTLT